MPSACTGCSRTHFLEEGGLCRACNTLRRLGQELRFHPHSRLEAQIAISWLEAALRGLEILRDASHFQVEETGGQGHLGLSSLSGARAGAAGPSTVDRQSGSTATGGDRREGERREGEAEAREGEERPRRRRKHRETREHDAKRRRR